MTAPSLAIVKPDWGIVGGAERVFDRLAAILFERGFEVCWYGVDVTGIGPDDVPGGVPVGLWERAREFFTYLAVVERCRRVDARHADLVVSTLPGSQAARGRRHLAVFYHHYRAFYDLAELLVRGGFVDAELHRACVAEVRRLDEHLFDSVDLFLAGSEEVRARLGHFNGIGRVRVLHAAEPVASGAPDDPGPPGDEILCVSRHEFPKRTELFVQAAALHRRPSVVVGDGGRLGWVQQLAHRWLVAGAEPTEPDTATWLCPVPDPVVGTGRPRRVGSVEFRGRVSDEELRECYRRALCVVAPAHREDYGLTVLEAMRHARPVVVCRDGGGLVDFLDDGVEGLVVDPEPGAVAAAVERLAADPALAEALGRAGRERAASYTWDRAADELVGAVGAVLDGEPASRGHGGGRRP